MGTSAGTSEIYSNQVSLQDSIPQRPATYVRGVFQGQLATTACSPQRPATSDRGVFQGQLARQAQPSPSDASTAEREPPVPSPPIAASRAAIQSPVPPVVRPKTSTNVPTVLELQLRRMHLQQQSFGCISSILRFKPLEAGWFCFFSFDSHLRLSAIGLFLHGLFDFEGIERQPWRLRCSFLASLFD